MNKPSQHEQYKIQGNQKHHYYSRYCTVTCSAVSTYTDTVSSSSSLHRPAQTNINTTHNNNKSSQVNYQEDGQHERLIQLVRNRSLRTQPNRARVQHKQPADHHTQPAATLTLTLTLATTTTTGRTRTRLQTAALPQSPRDPISQGHL
jgi:hypothetical protein